MNRSLILTITVVGAFFMALIALPACRTPGVAPDSEVKAEVDDRLTPLTAGLRVVNDKVESHINTMIDQARMETRGVLNSRGNWTDAQKEQLLRKVYNLLGAYRPGTGIFIGAFGVGEEVSLHPEVVYWLTKNLDDEQDEIAYVKFKQSRYGVNVVSLISGKVIAHKSLTAANHSISPVIKIQDTLIGTDKLGHFCMQGYWYWVSKIGSPEARHKYGQYMEGDPDLSKEERPKYEAMARKWIDNFRFGYFGAWSTGVISNADMQANEAGFQMYSDLFNDPDGYHFEVAHYSDVWPTMNEQNNPNKFSYGVDADDAAKPVKVEAEVKTILHLLKTSNYPGALIEGDRIVKKMDLVREFYTDADYERYKALRDAAWYYYMRCKDPAGSYLEAKPEASVFVTYSLPEDPVGCP